MSQQYGILGKALAPDLTADAKNRAVRSFIQGLGIDLATAIAAALLLWLPDADLSSRDAWIVLGTGLVRTVLGTVASYVMRRFVDGSAVPTPLPPAPVPEPNNDEPTIPVSEVHTTNDEFYGKA